MAAYVIVDIEVTDPAGYEEYRKLAGPAVAAFEGRFLVRGGATATLEGDWHPARIVVLEEHGETLGLRVSAVEDVANLTDNQIESPDNARVGRIANPLFRGVARLNERAVILLDASQLLT